jgi:formylmethanofuran dehydrogenase subunit B
MLNDKGGMPEANEIDAQLQLIAKRLVEARAPLIYGLTRLTVEAQELAVELAMCLRGAIDTPRGHLIPARGTSLQLHGEARATLGELQQHADLFVFVDCTATRGITESFVGKDHAKLPAKKVLQFNMAADDSTRNECRVLELACRTMDEVQVLHKKLKVATACDAAQEQLLAAWQAAQYPVLFYSPAGLVRSYGKSRAQYWIELLEYAVLARAKFGRAAAWPLEEAGTSLSNAAGAEYVLTARTGFPAAVQCFSGCAEYLPGVTDAEALLADGVIDAVLFLGEGPAADWNTTAKHHLKKIPTSIIASKQALQERAYQHQLECLPLDEEQGTIIREDGIPLPLRPVAPPTASTEKYLRRLLELVRELAATTAGAAP